MDVEMEKNRLKVLYIAPRFHTNQVPVVKGWLAEGDDVCFISHFARPGENYEFLEPEVLGCSRIFELIYGLYRAWCTIRVSGGNREKKLYEFRLKRSFPPVGMASLYIKDFRPDIVIVRERALYNIPFYRACKKRGIPCILYNQSPLWDRPGRDTGFLRSLLLQFFPKERITPVLGKPGDGNEITHNAFYVPFVMEPHYNWNEKDHFLNHKINIITVGRYEPRKQMLMLLEAVIQLAGDYPLQLTFVGEVVSDAQKAYYTGLQDKVCEYGLGESVSLIRNLTREQVFEEYRKADLFVLPSTRERASISQLEAMSCSLPIICSDTNGSSCYVEPEVNGYLFRDNDKTDLYQKLLLAVRSKEHLEAMGRNSYRLVQEKYRFVNYKQSVLDIVMRKNGNGNPLGRSYEHNAEIQKQR